MRDRAGAISNAATGTEEPGALYIITLLSSTAPLPIEAPAAPELAGLAVFRSRRVEDGRDRYRLHLGYFDSIEAAETVLPVVRQVYPAAWIGPAPNTDLGSLDDTSVAQFKFIQASRKPAGGSPATARPAAAVASVQAPSKSAKTPESAAPLLAPAEVLALLEPPPPKLSLNEQAALQPRAVVVGAIQRFAVQLVWSMDPIEMAQVAQLAIFDAYTLYKVQLDRVGRRWYGLRLGFFGDPVSARQVALYARSDFAAAAVVPVSDRECERASQGAINDHSAAASTPSRKAPEPAMELMDMARPGSPQTSAATRAAKPAVKKAAPSKPDANRKASRVLTAKTKAKDRSISKTTAELITELGGDEPTLGAGNDDPLNDTGVRHLSISVVRSRATLGKLFSRGVRRKAH